MKYTSLFERLLANSAESAEHSYQGTPCWCWTGTSMCRRRWYGRINVYSEGRVKTVQAHRLMAELVLGRKLDPEFETIDHACDWGPCVNPWHFRIATRVENTADMQRRRHGRPRIEMRPMLDPTLYPSDPLVRFFPKLRESELEIPF